MRVLHAVREYGHISHGFLADVIDHTARAGTEPWLAVNTQVDDIAPPASVAGRVLTWPRPRPQGADDLLPALGARRLAAGFGRVLAQTEPTVVHAHFGWSVRDVALACRNAAVPVLATFHGTDLNAYPAFRRREQLIPSNRRRGHRYHDSFPALDCAIVVSQTLEAKLRALGFPGRIVVLPAGIDLDAFPFRPPRQTPEDPRLLFVGRLAAVKGADVLLQAIARLPERHHSTTLTIVGDGPDRATLQAMAGDLSLTTRVRFVGAKQRAAVAAALADHDILVMSSRTLPDGQAEGSPVVTKEALAVGLPVVATDCGGTRETLPDALRDELVREGDPDALAAAISRLLDDSEGWLPRARIGRETAEHQFAWPALAARHVELYRELADRT